MPATHTIIKKGYKNSSIFFFQVNAKRSVGSGFPTLKFMGKM